MKNTFILSVEGVKEAPTAKAVQEALARTWGYGSGIKFRVDEGGHREMAALVSDYLAAEEALDKYVRENGITGDCDIRSSKGRKWKSLYDHVRLTRTAMVAQLREWGGMVHG